MMFDKLIKECVEDTILMLDEMECNYSEYMTFHSDLDYILDLYYICMSIYESTEEFKKVC